MHVTFKTLTGGVIYLDCDENATWLDIKNLIAERYPRYQVQSHRIIVNLQEVPDNGLLKDYSLQRVGTVHLIPQSPKIDEENHNFYVAVHNFYDEKIEQASLVGLTKVIPLTGNEQPDELNQIFETIYEARKKRIEKNKTSESSVQTIPLLALAAVPKNKNTLLIENDDKTTSCLTLNFECLGNQELDYKFLGYMLEDGTSVTSKFHANSKLMRINQAFHSFCAKKRAEEYSAHLEKIKPDATQGYEDVRKYLTDTMEIIFENRNANDIEQLLVEINSLLCVSNPNLKAQSELSKDANLFNIIENAETFSVVKKKLENLSIIQKTAQLEECRTVMKTLLLEMIENARVTYLKTGTANIPVSDLPSPVQQSSIKAGKRKVFKILPEDSIEDIKKTLGDYLTERNRFPNEFLGRFDRFFGGCSLKQKKAAVSALIKCLDGDITIIDLEACHKEALNQGQLGKLFSALKKTTVFQKKYANNSNLNNR